MSVYIQELLRALPAHVDAELIALVQRDAVALVPPGVSVSPRPPTTGVRRAVESLRSPEPADLVHGLDVDLPFRPAAPTVATIHDLAVFDVAWAFPRLKAAGERRLMSRTVRSADVILANSSFTAERLRSRFGREATITPLAPPSDIRPAGADDVERARREHGLPERFVLSVGTVEPRKGLACLGAACRDAGVELVIAGLAWPRQRPPDGARWLGFVPRSHLAGLYGACTVFAYPSRYEGFGLPAVEAMAAGAPVVATRVGALPEALGAAAAFAPIEDFEAWAATLVEVLNDGDRRAEMSRTGLRQVSAMSWDITAAATAAAYRAAGLGG